MSDVVVRNPVEALVVAYRERLEGALNQVIAWPGFLTAVLEDCANQPKLREAAKAAPETMIATLMQAAQLKLMPGSKYKRFYLIPRKNHGRMEVTGMTSYQGLAEVGQRHERVHSIEAFCVYEGEPFEFDPMAGVYSHKVNLLGDRSDDKLVGAYMVARITEKNTTHVCPTPIVWAMSREEILKRRAASDAYRYAEKDGQKDSPWHLWFPDMARKTVIRAGMVKATVPQEMWLAPTLEQEDRDDSAGTRDLPESSEKGPPAPSITRGEEIAQRLTGFDPEADKDLVT